MTYRVTDLYQPYTPQLYENILFHKKIIVFLLPFFTLVSNQFSQPLLVRLKHNF